MLRIAVHEVEVGGAALHVGNGGLRDHGPLPLVKEGNLARFRMPLLLRVGHPLAPDDQQVVCCLLEAVVQRFVRLEP